MIGNAVSRQTILDKLGEGGIGVIYKARFMHETKAASTLNHPNVCTIYAFEEHERQLLISYGIC